MSLKDKFAESFARSKTMTGPERKANEIMGKLLLKKAILPIILMVVVTIVASVANLNGWEPFDIFGLYAFSAGSFGLICSFFNGIYNIPMYISTGNFDKYLLTPKNTLLKVSTSAISTSAIGDLVFGIICFIIWIIL